MKYYKWIFDDDPEIVKVPGFAFTSIKDAKDWKQEFLGWVHPGSSGLTEPSLYEFNGVEPTPFPLGFSTMIISNKAVSGGRRVLRREEIKNALEYFSSKPPDWFSKAAAEKDVPLFHNLAFTVGALDPRPDKPLGYVYDVEVYYAKPAVMKIVRPSFFENRLNKALNRILFEDNRPVTLYVGRETISGPFIPGYCSDNVAQALTYAAWGVQQGSDVSIYQVDIDLPINTDPNNEIRTFQTDHTALMKLPTPGYFDPGVGEAIINVEVEPNKMTGEQVAASWNGGAGGSFNRDVDGNAILRALPGMFPEDYCPIVEKMMSEAYVDFEEDWPEAEIVRNCGIGF